MNKIKTKCSICGKSITIYSSSTVNTYGSKCESCKKKIADKLAGLNGKKVKYL